MSKIIKTLGDFRKLTENLDDDFAIELCVRTRVPEEELKKRRYPYPFDIEYFEGVEVDDIGYSDKVVCFGINSLQQKESTDVDLERDVVQFCFDEGINVTPRQAKTIAYRYYERGLNSRKQ